MTFYMKNIILLAISIVIALAIYNSGNVSAAENTVCCERTNSGAFCQNVPANECSPGSNQAPTSCDATSFCRSGTCYDSSEGTCLDNTPQIVCSENGGVWSEESPPQCGLGCCVLGDQAAFVTLVRCKKLSGVLGLQTNYNPTIKTEAACIAEVQSQDRGACVFEKDFERNCKFTTKAECSLISGSGGMEFYKDKLCSAEELGTICGLTTKTTCVPGKDEVYFVDTCGNPANIYDSSKITDKEYWSNVKSKDESCGFGSGNQGSRSCGNCNYLQGSICRDEKNAGGNPSYGDFMCADLNCVYEGEERLHGESWCVSDPKEGDGQDRVGSRDFRFICIDGEVVSEACADFRAEECVENSIETENGGFRQAACRVNRWQDCIAQTEEKDCVNLDRRDCFWYPEGKLGNKTGACLPKTSPGLNFWESAESNDVCNIANRKCVVIVEKGVFGGEECKENCECLENSWVQKQNKVCSSLGDCGPKVNFLGQEGYDKSFNIKINGKKQK